MPRPCAATCKDTAKSLLIVALVFLATSTMCCPFAEAASNGAEVKRNNDSISGKKKPSRKQRKAAEQLNIDYSKKFSEISRELERFHHPVESDQYMVVGQLLKKSKEVLLEYDRHDDSDLAEALSTDASTFESQIESIEILYKNNAANAFEQFDHFSGVDFLSQYPVPELSKQVLAACYKKCYPSWEKRKSDDLELLLGTKWLSLLDDERQQFAGLYSRLRFTEAKSTIDTGFRTILETNSVLGKHNLALPKVDGMRAGFISILDSAEFQINLEVPELFIVEESKSINPLELENYDLVIVLVGNGKLEVKNANEVEVKSNYVTGHQMVPNPNYEVARLNMLQAQINYNRVANSNQINSYSYDNAASAIIGGIAGGLAAGNAQSEYQRATAIFQNTPPLVQQPIFQPYTFKVAELNLSKSIAGELFLFEPKNRRYMRCPLAENKEQLFTVSLGVNQSDVNLNVINEKTQSYDAITTWTSQELNLDLGEILRKVPSVHDIQTLKSMKDVWVSNIQKTVNDTGTSVSQVSVGKGNNLASVVVVEAGESSGAGFFVTPELICTNSHCVAGAGVISLTYSDGRKAAATVVASDPGIDIAILRSNIKGVPLTLFDGEIPSLGTEVQAIGHPKGLNFSVTRGVISAARRLGDLTIIQTDAPINPGNSGGPLIYENKALGMNTMKLSQPGIEGIGFAIYSSSIREYLKRSGISL